MRSEDELLYLIRRRAAELRSKRRRTISVIGTAAVSAIVVGGIGVLANGDSRPAQVITADDPSGQQDAPIDPSEPHTTITNLPLVEEATTSTTTTPTTTPTTTEESS